jgi:hypothetical protein
LEIGSDPEPDIFSIDITASAMGYEEVSKSQNFEEIQEEVDRD